MQIADQEQDQRQGNRRLLISRGDAVLIPIGIIISILSSDLCRYPHYQPKMTVNTRQSGGIFNFTMQPPHTRDLVESFPSEKETSFILRLIVPNIRH
jgi:hypothetical protein